MQHLLRVCYECVSKLDPKQCLHSIGGELADLLRGKTTLETSGEGVKLHSKRVKKMFKLHSKRVVKM